jgi:homoserine kinase type II
MRDTEIAALLPLWAIPAGTAAVPAGARGTNNRTFAVDDGRRRYVLRVSGFLSVAEVSAEHRILRRLREGGGLPFRVPEPVPALDGRTVIETAAGPAVVCRWLPGAHPVLDGDAALTRVGAAAGLRSAGMSARHAEVIEEAADRAGRWWPSAGGLPAQVIHGDIASSNVLADPGTGTVTGLLDFELAGAGYRVQDVAAALCNCAAPGLPGWPRRVAALLRGWSSVQCLEPAEVTALPELLLARSLGSVLWRAARWRAGIGSLDELTSRAGHLEETARWLADSAEEFLGVAAAAGGGAPGRGRRPGRRATRGRPARSWRWPSSPAPPAACA